MTPTPEDTARDLRADLEVCENATPGPWVWDDERDNFPGVITGIDPETGGWGEALGLSSDVAEFVMGSRMGWPAAIRRALAAEAEAARLREAVATHHAQKADDRCIEDDDRLYAAVGLPPCDRRVGSKAEMLKNCERFIDRRCEGGGWPSYAELEAELASVKADAASLRDAFGAASAAYFEAMKGKPRGEWAGEPAAAWRSLYEAVRDHRAGLDLLAELATLKGEVATLRQECRDLRGSLEYSINCKPLGVAVIGPGLLREGER